MKFTALVSGHIYIDEKHGKDIEILSQIDNDYKGTDAFCDINDALLDEIDIGTSEDYYFIAAVEAEIVKYETWESTEWDTEYHVKEINSMEEIEILVM